MFEPSALEVRFTVFMTNTMAAPFYRSFVKSLGIKGDEHVLDVGSGSGTIARMLAKRLKNGGRVTCLDPSFVWLRVAHSRLHRYSNVDFLQADAASPELETGYYDLVVLHYTLHEISDRVSAIKNLSRVLRPAGRLVIREPLQHAPEITPEEIELLCQQHGLERLNGLSCKAPLVGTYYHGVFSKPEDKY